MTHLCPLSIPKNLQPSKQHHQLQKEDISPTNFTVETPQEGPRMVSSKTPNSCHDWGSGNGSIHIQSYFTNLSFSHLACSLALWFNSSLLNASIEWFQRAWIRVRACPHYFVQSVKPTCSLSIKSSIK